MVSLLQAGNEKECRGSLLELVEDPAGHEVAEGGGDVGDGAIAGVTSEAGGDFGGP